MPPQKKTVITDHMVRIKGLKLYYRLVGDPANPPLVFLQGWGLRWNRFGPYSGIKVIVKELAQYYYVIFPELPGLLRSETPPVFLGYESYAKSVHQLLQHLGIDKPIVVGQSFGGAIASIYAKLYPADLRQLVLVNSILSYQASTAYPKLLHWWGKTFPKILASTLMPTVIKKLVVNLFFGTPWSHITKPEIEHKAKMEDPFLYVYDHDFNFLQVPLLMIWGEKDIKVPLRRAIEIQKQNPRATLIPIKGGHSTLSFRPRKITKLITENLAKG